MLEYYVFSERKNINSHIGKEMVCKMLAQILAPIIRPTPNFPSIPLTRKNIS